MIAVDTRSGIAFLAGADGPDVPFVDRLLAERQVCMPPVVLTELLSDPRLPSRVAAFLAELPRLSLKEGYWERAGALRARVLARKRKAPLADVLIAQSCVDHSVRLVTRDTDFRPFVELGSLEVLP